MKDQMESTIDSSPTEEENWCNECYRLEALRTNRIFREYKQPLKPGREACIVIRWSGGKLH